GLARRRSHAHQRSQPPEARSAAALELEADKRQAGGLTAAPFSRYATPRSSPYGYTQVRWRHQRRNAATLNLPLATMFHVLSTASSTCSAEMPAMQCSFLDMQYSIQGGMHSVGAQNKTYGSIGRKRIGDAKESGSAPSRVLKITTVGIPSAPAMWPGPESFPKNKAACEISATDSTNVVVPATRTAPPLMLEYNS